MAWDQAVFFWLNHDLARPGLDPWARFITYSGEYAAIWLLAALLFFLFGRARGRGLALRLVAGLLLFAVVGDLILKPLVGRPRPYEVWKTVRLIVVPPGGDSFPSGHAGTSAVAAALINQEYPGWLGALAVLYAVAVGLSRVYVGVHYPSDVLAGWLLGWGEAYLIRWLAARIRGRKAGGSTDSTTGRG